MEDPSGRRVVEAIGPYLEQWLDTRKRGGIFHTAQVLTIHGCFGEYLCKIEKKRLARCHHCVAENDTADHILMRCPAWEIERNQLVEQVEDNLVLPIVIGAIIREEEAWKGFTTFCGKVMRKKEDAIAASTPSDPSPSPRIASTLIVA